MNDEYDCRYNNWNGLDLRTVQAEYGVMPLAQLAEKMGRSPRSIQEFARRHGISACRNRWKATGAKLAGSTKYYHRHREDILAKKRKERAGREESAA